jgi:hypothetical protein
VVCHTFLKLLLDFEVDWSWIGISLLRHVMASASLSLSLVIRNPSVREDFSLVMQGECTVGALKAMLERDYPSRPSAARQRLIFFGALLQDHQILSDVFSAVRNPKGASCFLTHCQVDASNAITVHLVISPTAPASPDSTENDPIAQRRLQYERLRMQQQRQQAQQQQQIPQPQVQPPLVAPQDNQAGGGGDLALLFKLVVMVFILLQGGGTIRAIVLLVGAFILYL